MPCNFFLQLCLQHTKCSSIVESSIFLSCGIIYYRGQYIETFLRYASWWWKGQYIKVLLKYPSWWWKCGIHVVRQKFTLVSKEVLKVFSHLSFQMLAPSSFVSVTFSSFLVAEIAMSCNFFFNSVCNTPSVVLESSIFLSCSTIYSFTIDANISRPPSNTSTTYGVEVTTLSSFQKLEIYYFGDWERYRTEALIMSPNGLLGWDWYLLLTVVVLDSPSLWLPFDVTDSPSQWPSLEVMDSPSYWPSLVASFDLVVCPVVLLLFITVHFSSRFFLLLTWDCRPFLLFLVSLYSSGSDIFGFVVADTITITISPVCFPHAV